MLNLIINNQTDISIPKNLDFKIWIDKTLKILQYKDLKGDLELNFVDEKTIKELNKQFRNIDKVTDILSFSFLEGDNFPQENLIGQLFLEPITVKKQADSHKIDFKDEIEFLFVHGLLHIFGYDHENENDFREMFSLHAQIMPDPKWQSFVKQIALENFGIQEF